MRPNSGHLVAYMTLAFTLIVVPTARATKIDPLLLEELVLSSDCVALVECETAGGLAARFKVTESFKGPKAGTSIVLSWLANYWGEQFPVALCGERYLVTASKAPPSNLISTSIGGPVPLWWRRIPADFRLPFLQGMELIAPEDEKDFGKTRAKIKALLAMNPAQQEAALLRALIEHNLLGRGEKTDKLNVLRKRFDALYTAEALVEELMRLAREDPKTWEHPTFRIVDKGGMAKSLAIVDRLPKDKTPWTESHMEYIRESIRGRLTREPVDRPMRDELAEFRKPPTADELPTLRKVLADRESNKWFEAFFRLTFHDPASVTEMLIKLEVKEPQDRRERGMNHGLASFFAHECAKDRENHLTALLDAKDPWIRATAAVYLCFENEQKGLEALTMMTKLKGTPGGWAALTLARRGHKDAVPRALDLFPKKWDEVSELDNRGTPEENLQNHLLVLLSNSAHAGKAPQYRMPKGGRPTSESLQAWWQQHRDRVVLRDPWMELLSKQKID